MTTLLVGLLPACVTDEASADDDPVTASLTAAAAGTLTPTGCVTNVRAGDHTFNCDGNRYAVRLPATCASGGCGVILDIHGLTMNGAIEDNNTNLRAIGEREGYVVIQPSEASPPWGSWNPAVDNDKVWAFLTSARTAYQIDPKRVHITGFSQGAKMTWTFACQHADVIASAAPASFSGCSAPELAAANREVPVLYMHGTRDAIASFTDLAIPQRDAVVSAWEMGAPTTIASGSSYNWSRYTNANGTVFEFIEHDFSAASRVLGGHCFPGSTDRGNVWGQLFSFACTPPHAFIWGEEVVKFFQAHPLP